MTTTSARRRQIVQGLADKEYRDAFVAEHISSALAFQIHEMRESRGWTQEELGRRAGIAQERISLLENPNYGRCTLSTLKQIASAFDVALIVRFAPFSQLADWAADLSPEDLAVPHFEHDEQLEPPNVPMRIEATTEYRAS